MGVKDFLKVFLCFDFFNMGVDYGNEVLFSWVVVIDEIDWKVDIINGDGIDLKDVGFVEIFYG